MALEAHTDLNQAPACQDDADSSDNAAYDVRHIVDSCLSFTFSQDRNHKDTNDGASYRCSDIALQNGLSLVLLLSHLARMKIPETLEEGILILLSVGF